MNNLFAKVIHKNRLAICVGTGLAVATTLGHTQESMQLSEIIVTAQKRTENIQDVPISIQSFDAETLTALGVSEVSKLSVAVPSVVFKEQGGAMFTAIRGLGSQTNNNGSYNSVGFYVDGAYTPRGQTAVLDTSNVESIQVLKGPQGALYGRNATAGAIIITTKTPLGGDELSGSLSATVGSDDLTAYKGYMSGGLTETVGASFSFSVEEQDGYVKNLSPDFGPDLGARESESFQGKVSFSPTDNVTATLTLRRMEYISDRGQLWQSVNPQGSTAFLAGTLSSIIQGGGAPASVADPIGAMIASQAIFDFPYGTTSDNYINIYSPRSLTVQYDAKVDSWDGNFTAFEDDLAIFELKAEFDSFELVSISSYEDYYADQTAGVLPYTWADGGATFDAVFGGGLDANGQVGFQGQYDDETYGQEFRISSTDSAIGWMLGANYFLDKGNTSLQQGVFGLSIPIIDNDYENESYAFYGQVKYPISESLQLTTGLRYTYEESTIEDYFPPAAPKQTRDFDQITYDVTLTWDLDTVMYYGAIRTGFKSGSLNSINTRDNGVDPEELTAYEVGFKSELADGRVRLNGAAFFYDFSNAHLNAFDPEAGGVTVIIDQAEIEYLGLELDLQALLAENLTFTGSILALDAEHTSDAESGGAAFVPLDGNTPNHAAEFTASVGLNYLLVTQDGEFSFDAITQYSSGYYLDSENLIGTGGNTDSDFLVLNLSANYTHSSGIYGRLFCDNVTDEEYFVTGVVQSGIAQFAGAAQPREYGLQIGYKF